jgi:hypothetical protein
LGVRARQIEARIGIHPSIVSLAFDEQGIVSSISEFSLFAKIGVLIKGLKLILAV